MLLYRQEKRKERKIKELIILLLYINFTIILRRAAKKIKNELRRKK